MYRLVVVMLGDVVVSCAGTFSFAVRNVFFLFFVVVFFLIVFFVRLWFLLRAGGAVAAMTCATALMSAGLSWCPGVPASIWLMNALFGMMLLSV